MSTTAFPLLPKLKEEHSISLKASGAWQPQDIANIIRSINIDNSQVAGMEGINSIPNIWARPLLFEMALYDNKHILHNRIAGEWRGLMAMLALREMRGLPLRSVRISLSPNSERTFTKFEDALIRLLPESTTLSKNAGWKNLYIILFNDKPIGMTSPTTMVCTAPNYYNRISNLNWFDGRYLIDPIPCLNQTEKGKLAKWLMDLRYGLLTEESSDRTKLNVFIGLIQQFEQELGTFEDMEISREGLGMDTALYHLVDKPIKSETRGDAPSWIRLTPSPGKNPDISLLIRKDNIWGYSDSDIIVLGDINMASVPFSGWGNDPKLIGRKPLPNGVLWRNADYFFTPYLFMVNYKDNPFPGCREINKGKNIVRGGDSYTPILPIKNELLEYLSMDELCKRIVFEDMADSVKVTLFLTLSGPGQNGKEISITHEYKWSDSSIKVVETPLLEVWPDLEIKSNDSQNSWSLYYMYYKERASTALQFVPEPYGIDSSAIVNEIGDKGSMKGKLFCLSEYPEALICIVNNPDGQGYGTEKVDAGILPLRKPRSVTSKSEKWKIGIDFGTTSTNIYTSVDNRLPQPVLFNDYFVQVTTFNQVDRVVNMWTDFLPCGYISTRQGRKSEFLSLYCDMRRDPEAGQLRALVDGHIQFLRDYRGIDPNRRELVGDLKWGEDQASTVRTEAFLEQLCLQASVYAASEGANEIAWYFSFPTAFSANTRNRYESFWKHIIDRCQEKTGIAMSFNSMSESLAAARFFEATVLSVDYVRGCVFIDIGGGTSDISVWQESNQEMLYQTSLRFAGRDIFLEILRRNPSFLKRLGDSSDDSKLTDEDIDRLHQVSNDKTIFYTQADAILADNGEKWLKYLPKISGNKIVQGFISLIALGLGALFYYNGLVLRYLYESDKYTERLPDVFIAGNGSNLLHWLGHGNFNRTTPVNDLFKDLLTRAAGFRPESFIVNMSESPKKEAAFGLVCSNQEYTDVHGNHEIIAGEKSINGTDIVGTNNWGGLLSPEIINQGVSVDKEMTNLKEFVEVFNKHCQNLEFDKVVLNKDMLTRIKDGVDQRLIDMKRQDEASISVEPLFILEVKKLLELKADEWARKAST